MKGQRIKALDPPYAESIQNDFNTIMPPDIPPLNIFRTVANNLIFNVVLVYIVFIHSSVTRTMVLYCRLM
jgi:hypothetical protein